MKLHLVSNSSKNGEERPRTRINVGVVSRGDPGSLYLVNYGMVEGQHGKHGRFPHLPDKAWQDIFTEHIMPRCPGMPTVHSDGHGMYKSGVWYKDKYEHHSVKHQ